MRTEINPIGFEYNVADMFVDTVGLCDGIYLKDDAGNSYNYNTGEQYMDGTIVNCFYHDESDCGFMVVECSGVYFEVWFNDYVSCLPKYFRDSTQLSGGKLW